VLGQVLLRQLARGLSGQSRGPVRDRAKEPRPRQPLVQAPARERSRLQRLHRGLLREAVHEAVFFVPLTFRQRGIDRIDNGLLGGGWYGPDTGFITRLNSVSEAGNIL
jgi:hypothetical protein